MKISTAIRPSDLQHLLRCALFAAQDHQKTAEALAASLRAGNEHPLFAPGEDGARAADYMAENHRNTAELANELLAIAFDAERIVVHLGDE